MSAFYSEHIAKSPRIPRLIEHLYAKLPVVEADRAVLLTESYKQTEGDPIIIRRAKAFDAICRHLPIIIRPEELIVGSSSQAPRGCQVFPEFSYSWLEDEFETMETREADPFHIDDATKATLHEVYKYWKGRTTSELATSYMAPEALVAIEHNMFTPGNYFYNGIGHVTVCYGRIAREGLESIKAEAAEALLKCKVGDGDYARRSHFLQAVILSCEAACVYAERYSALAREEAAKEKDPIRRKELEVIAENCARVPRYGARNFYEACQSFWFIQQLLQVESSGHSISPGRFDQYMYPFFKKDLEEGKITREFAQEIMDCIWVKLNDLNKIRDAASAKGFAGYSLFQNLIAGGQTPEGLDATNDLSFMCIEATMHVLLPQPSFSVRVWNGSPQEFLMRAAELTRTGVGLPAYYNDEVIIPSLLSRGLSMSDARDYNIIGCVEPQKAFKTDGWHDAAFFNMCRPLELVFSNGMDKGVQVGLKTGDVTQMRTFDEFYDAYKKQMNYMISLLVNADNAIDVAHAERCPLPFLSGMIEDCIGRGKSVQEGGAIYNFTGPQGFGIANMTDALYAVKTLVYEQKTVSMADLRDALAHNYGKERTPEEAKDLTEQVAKAMMKDGIKLSESQIRTIYETSLNDGISAADRAKYKKIHDLIEAVPKFGNDIPEVDNFARDVAYTYTRPMQEFRNPRGGQYQAGLYPVSANVPLGAQTGATPDGRYAGTPVADGVSPYAGRDTHGPTAAANSVSHLDHSIASNGTLFNMKFHPSALAGREGLANFVAFIRSYFDQKGSHMQFNVVSRETLLDAQKHPENYRSLVVRVAGYSALFTQLSRSLQDDIISRTEQTSL
ncbi:MAG: glycyl radical protein [Firmicutes bacterium]|nr:glycyl radical protein [Bacillota bacterium]